MCGSQYVFYILSWARVATWITGGASDALLSQTAIDLWFARIAGVTPRYGFKSHRARLSSVILRQTAGANLLPLTEMRLVRRFISLCFIHLREQGQFLRLTSVSLRQTAFFSFYHSGKIVKTLVSLVLCILRFTFRFYYLNHRGFLLCD